MKSLNKKEHRGFIDKPTNADTDKKLNRTLKEVIIQLLAHEHGIDIDRLINSYGAK